MIKKIECWPAFRQDPPQVCWAQIFLNNIRLSKKKCVLFSSKKINLLLQKSNKIRNINWKILPKNGRK